MQPIYLCIPLYEGFGYPPLEAMASGLPVICANTTSLPEVVGNAGLLIQPTQQAFTTAIEKMLSKKDVRKDYAQKGRKRAKRFAWKHIASKYSNTFEQLIDKQ